MTRKTSLYEEHKRLGARLVEFAGWEMPVQYTGVIDEHTAVRTAAGIFDVSHMGEIEVTGPGAFALIQRLTTNDISKMADGRAQYSMFLNEKATVIDDIIVYRFDAKHYIIVVNASNVKKDLDWCLAHQTKDAKVTDRSDDFALIALQGPKSEEILARLTKTNLAAIQTYWFSKGSVAGCEDVIIARTGYTGERGFELFCRTADAPKIWQALLEEGKPLGLKPAGLGARDTLRLEMKYSLYGHEITEETNPLEAGLSWVVKMEKAGGFIGQEKLAAIKAAGLQRKLVGFTMKERGIPRQGYPILIGDKAVGIVTSGTMSPSLQVAIGIAYVPTENAAVGNKIWVDIRGQAREAVVVETPFYQPNTK